jgi:uncharacterized protein YndB with AHSA1/START domain
MLDLTCHTEILISSSSQTIWQVLTNPQHIKKYLFGTETETDWKRGSKIVFRGEYQGQSYEDHGTIKDIEKEKFIVYDYWSSFSGVADIPGNYSLITYKLAVQKDGVMLSVEQKGFTTRDGYDHSEKNWEMVLKGIKDTAENINS